MKHLEDELLLIGSYFLNQSEILIDPTKNLTIHLRDR